MRVSQELQNAKILLADIEALPNADMDENPRVTRFVYGEIPPVYREVRKAMPLNAHEKYCVLAFGDGFDKAGEYFYL